MIADPFDTGRWRAAVLRAWSEQPSRFREDSNLEEDFAHGYYRDRVIVELAQNAADAARRAGRPGRLWLRLATSADGDTLTAANTGAPLDISGVRALATLRASAKAPASDTGSVGRFGVGFAAIRAVADEIAVLSSTGGVRFSQADASAELADALGRDGGHAELAAEIARREGRIPALRLPFPAQGQPPVDFDTVVVAELIDQLASDAVRRQLNAVDDLLILSLPGLTEIVVQIDNERRTIAGADERWLTARSAGQFPAELLADRPVEERDRTGWSVIWAIPRPGSGSGLPKPSVLHAPTPTDEPSTLPAALIATFPLDPTRRHIAPGPATDRLVEHAADCYADALEAVVADPAFGPDAIWQLIPVGLPASELDDALCAAARRAARSRVILPAVASAPHSTVRPDEAVTLTGPGATDRGVTRGVALLEPALVRADTAAARAVCRALDVATMTLADAVDRLPPHWPVDLLDSWFAAVLPAARQDPLVREALATVPVPMASGRVSIGARGVIVLDDGADVASHADDGPGTADAIERLARWGVPLAVPGLAPELLGLLGADVVGVRDLFDDPSSAVRPALEERIDQILDGDVFDEPAPADTDMAAEPAPADETLDRTDAALVEVTNTVLSLVPGGTPRTHPWTEALPVPVADGQLCPASDAVFADSWLAKAQGPNAQPVAATYVQRWGVDALIRLGVPTRPPTRSISDVTIGEGSDDLDDPPDDWLAYCDYVADEAGPGSCDEVLVVDGLELLDLAAALPHLLTEPDTRAALLQPVRVHNGNGLRTVRSYASWWCADRSGGPFALASASPLVRKLLPPVPAHWQQAIDAEPASSALIGAVASLTDLDARHWPVVLAASGGRARAGDWTAPEALDLWRRLAQRCASDGGWNIALPDVVGALIVDKDVLVGVAADVDAVTIVDAPCQLPLVDGPVVLVPATMSAALAACADLPMAGDVAAAPSSAECVELPPMVAALMPAEMVALSKGWWRHDDLVVDGVPVRWWVDPLVNGGGVHAVSAHDAGAALAWVSGHWAGRDIITQLVAGDEPTWSVGDVFGLL